MSRELRTIRASDTDWALFTLEFDVKPEVRLDSEHDRYEWVTLADARVRCKPEVIVSGLDLAARDHQ